MEILVRLIDVIDALTHKGLMMGDLVLIKFKRKQLLLGKYLKKSMR